MELPLHGSCQCGAVQYSVDAQPLFTYACHCYNCQKRTGSAFSMGVIIPVDKLTLAGELTEWGRVSDAGTTNTRYSCLSCGNIIYGIGDDAPTLAKMQAGTLEDTSEIEPALHIWVKRKQPWVVLQPEARQFETQPENAVEYLQAARDYHGSGNPTDTL